MKLGLFLYNLLLNFIQPFILIFLFVKNKDYRYRLRERLGYYSLSLKDKKVLWVHVASVGELMAVVPLIRSIPQPLLVTCLSFNGIKQASRVLPKVTTVFLPIDTKGNLERFLNKFQPRLALITETELWPNLVFSTARRSIPLFLINARLTNKTVEQYLRIRWLFSPLLKCFTKILVQSEPDYRRFKELGVDDHNLELVGNLKFDISISEATKVAVKNLKKRLGERTILIAASTHDGEEEIVLKSFQEIQSNFPSSLLFLVPRYPDRSESIARLAKKNFRVQLFSNWQKNLSAEVSVLIGDVLGELLVFYGVSDLVFVGGSLLPIGGHNLLEPLAFKKPLLAGPFLENVQEISDQLLSIQGMYVVKNASELTAAASLLLMDEAKRETLANNGYQFLEQHRGVLGKILKILNEEVNLGLL